MLNSPLNSVSVAFFLGAVLLGVQGLTQRTSNTRGPFEDSERPIECKNRRALGAKPPQFGCKNTLVWVQK